MYSRSISTHLSNSGSRLPAICHSPVIPGFIVYAMWLLIQGTRHGLERWRAALLLALPATLLFPVAPLLSVGLMLKNYRTDVPLETFQAMTYVSLAMSVIFGFLLMGAAAALVVTFYPDAVPALRRENRAVTAFDAVAALLAATGMALLVHRFQGILAERFHAQTLFSISSPDIISRGFVYLRESQELLHEVRILIKDTSEKSTRGQNPINVDFVKDNITDAVSKFLLTKTAKRPMVIPVILTI